MLAHAHFKCDDLLYGIAGQQHAVSHFPGVGHAGGQVTISVEFNGRIP